MGRILGMLLLVHVFGKKTRKGKDVTRKSTVLTFAFAALVALPAWAAPPNRGRCSDIPLRLIVAKQTQGMGGISGDGLSIYNNPNNSNDPFNGGTEYDEGVAFLCNGSNDFVVNLRGTSPVRYLNLDFSVPLALPDTAGGAVDLTGQQIHLQGQQINEMANSALYNSNGVFTTCSGLMLNPLSRTVTGGNAWFHPTSIEEVQDCLGGAGPDAANTPDPTSDVVVTQVDACTWTVSPALDSSNNYRIGVGEVVKNGGHSTWVPGGQYHMPFSYKVEKLNCTP